MPDTPVLPELTQFAERIDRGLQEVAAQIERALEPLTRPFFQETLARWRDELTFEAAGERQVRRVVAHYRPGFMARPGDVRSVGAAERRPEAAVVDDALRFGISIALDELRTAIWDDDPLDVCRQRLMEIVRREASRALYEEARALGRTDTEQEKRAEVDLDEQPAPSEPEDIDRELARARIAALMEIATPRERELLELLVAKPGASDEELAAELGLKPATVRSMKHHLRRRLKGS